MLFITLIIYWVSTLVATSCELNAKTWMHDPGFLWVSIYLSEPDGRRFMCYNVIQGIVLFRPETILEETIYA